MKIEEIKQTLQTLLSNNIEDARKTESREIAVYKQGYQDALDLALILLDNIETTNLK